MTKKVNKVEIWCSVLLLCCTVGCDSQYQSKADFWKAHPIPPERNPPKPRPRPIIRASANARPPEVHGSRAFIVASRALKEAKDWRAFGDVLGSESANVMLYIGGGADRVAMGAANSKGAFIEFLPHEKKYIWKAVQEKLVEILENGI
jgi:hypothetical protein